MALWEYFTENKFTDLVLITRDRRINAHSAVVTQSCPFLSGLIKNHFLTFEDVILSIPDVFGDELSESLYDVYSGENSERFSILLGSEQSSSNNDLESEGKFEKGLNKYLEGVPVTVLLKNDSDIEDILDGHVDVSKLNNGSSNKTSDEHFQVQDVSVEIGFKEKMNFIGHDRNFISPFPENDSCNSLSTTKVKVDNKCGDHCEKIFSSKSLLTKHSHLVHWKNYGYSTCPENLVICSANKVNWVDDYYPREIFVFFREPV